MTYLQCIVENVGLCWRGGVGGGGWGGGGGGVFAYKSIGSTSNSKTLYQTSKTHGYQGLKIASEMPITHSLRK